MTRMKKEQLTIETLQIKKEGKMNMNEEDEKETSRSRNITNLKKEGKEEWQKRMKKLNAAEMLQILKKRKI